MTEAFADAVHPEFGCPQCGTTAVDQLVWLDETTVRCSCYGTEYQLDHPPAAAFGNGSVPS